MRVAVIGASGFLGSNLAYYVRQQEGIELFGLSRRKSIGFKASETFGNFSNLLQLLSDGDFDVIVNCVAVADHRLAEKSPLQAREVNATFAGALASTARDVGAFFIQISTDAVFSGASPHRYSERDQCCPTSEYGKTKLLGEQEVVNKNPSSLVLRTNFFGWSRDGEDGVLDFFYRRLRASRPTIAFDDYRVSSLFLGDFSRILFELVHQRPAGVFHVVSANPLSKFEFAARVADVFGFSRDLLESGSIAQFRPVPSSPVDLGLATDRLSEVTGLIPPSTEEGILRARSEKDATFNWFGRRE